ncbi:MAG: aldo/keto reductase, partial [Planctomycetota bacterium]
PMIRRTRNHMDRTLIRNTDVEVPQVVFGTSAFGNLYQRMSDDCRIEIVGEMLNHTDGVIALDSAGKYGAGLALEKIGETLSKLRVPRERVCISNKLGWRRVPLTSPEPTFEPDVWMEIEHDAVQDISYDGILRCWEEGNQLLGDYDTQLVSVHDPDVYLASATDQLDHQSRWNNILEAYKALAELRSNGLAKAIGVGSKDWRTAQKLVEHCDLDWVMLANCLTIYRHEPELLEFIEAMHRQGIVVINSAIFHGGFLVGSDFFDYVKVDSDTEHGRQLLDWRMRFYEICDQYNALPAEVCASFAVSHPAVSAIALNTSRPSKVAANLRLPNVPIDDRVWADMKTEGLLIGDYPYLNVTV